MKSKKFMCSFLVLFLMSFIQISHAELFTYNTVYSSLVKSVPEGVRVAVYCAQRSKIFSDVIDLLKRNNQYRYNLDGAKDYVVRTLIMIMCEYYPRTQKCWCKFAETGIIAASSNYDELEQNLSMINNVYTDLSNALDFHSRFALF